MLLFPFNHEILITRGSPMGGLNIVGARVNALNHLSYQSFMIQVEFCGLMLIMDLNLLNEFQISNVGAYGIP